MNITPDTSAGDHSPEALAAAAHNNRLVTRDWHDSKLCHADPDDFDLLAYYRDPETGDHGWMCTKCLRVVQTG